MFDTASVTLGTVAVPRALAAASVLSTSGGRAENTGDTGGARSDYSARDSLVPAAGLYNAEVDRSGSMSGFHTSISISPESDARFNAQVIGGQFQTVAGGTSGEIESSLTTTVGPVPGSELALPQQVEAALKLVADKREVRADEVREQQLQENLDRIIAGNGVVEESEEEILVVSNKLDLPPAGTHPLVMAMLLGFDFSSQTNEALVSNAPRDHGNL